MRGGGGGGAGCGAEGWEGLGSRSVRYHCISRTSRRCRAWCLVGNIDYKPGRLRIHVDTWTWTSSQTKFVLPYILGSCTHLPLKDWLLFPPAPRVRRGLSSDTDGRARIYGLRRPRSRRLSQYVYASLVCFIACSPKQTERRRYPRVTSFPCYIRFPVFSVLPCIPLAAAAATATATLPPPPPRLFLLLLVLETSLTAFARRNDSTKRNRISTRIGASPSFPSPLSLFYLLSFSFLSSLFSVLFSFLSSFPPLLLFFFSSSAALCCSRCTSPSRYSTHHFCRQSQLPTCLRMLLEFIGRVARIFQFLLLWRVYRSTPSINSSVGQSWIASFVFRFQRILLLPARFDQRPRFAGPGNILHRGVSIDRTRTRVIERSLFTEQKYSIN